MIPAPIPSNDLERLESLRAHNILDTLPEEVYDDITRIASEICGTPIALLTIVDEKRLWVKSRYGSDESEMQREQSFCAHAIIYPNQVFVVPDARYDERFHDYPIVTGNPPIAFYAGVPVQSADGHALGSICVMDNRPRELSEQKLESLKALAKLVNAHFELRKTRLELQKNQESIKTVQLKVREMENYVAAIRNKSLSNEQEQQLQSIRQAVESLKEIGNSKDI